MTISGKIVGKTFRGFLPIDFELDPRVILRLRAVGRVDLALEHTVLASEWSEVFSAEMRARAQRNLATLELLSALEKRRPGEVPESQSALWHDPLVVTDNRVTWVSEARFPVWGSQGGCEGSEQLELELLSESFIPWCREHQRHVLFCPQCRSQAPLVTDIYDRLVHLEAKLFVMYLETLAAIQRVDDERIEEFLSRQAPEGCEDWLHAAELLGWRAVVGGEHLSRMIELRHLTPESDDQSAAHPWAMFASGTGHPAMVSVFKSLDPKLLRAGIASLLVSRMFRDTDFDFTSLPSDGDLREFMWAVPVTEAADFGTWQELLGYAPIDRTDRPFLKELVEVVAAAALGVAPEYVGDQPIQAGGQPESELLRNTHDMLWVTSQRIEAALPPTPERVRDSLSQLLGEDVLDRLPPVARQTLISGEWIFLQSPSPTAGLREIAQAFEWAVKARVLPLLLDSRYRGWNPTLFQLGEAIEAVCRCPGRNYETFNRAGLDPGAVADAIDRVRKQQNELKHDPNKGARILKEEAREIRAAWYGLKPGEPGVFHVITGAQRP